MVEYKSELDRGVARATRTKKSHNLKFELPRKFEVPGQPNTVGFLCINGTRDIFLAITLKVNKIVVDGLVAEGVENDSPSRISGRICAVDGHLPVAAATPSSRPLYVGRLRCQVSRP
jgi:hypothetical protein